MSEKINIKIKKLDGTVYSLEVSSDVPVPELKALIQELSSIPSNLQRVIYQGKVLRDDKDISFYNIKDGNTLHLAERAPEPSTNSNNQTSTPMSSTTSTTTTTNTTPQARIFRFGGNMAGGNIPTGGNAMPMGVGVSPDDINATISNVLRSLVPQSTPDQLDTQIRNAINSINSTSTTTTTTTPTQPTTTTSTATTDTNHHVRISDYLDLSNREIERLLQRSTELSQQLRNQENITSATEREQLQNQLNTLSQSYNRLSQTSNLLAQNLQSYRLGSSPSNTSFSPSYQQAGISQIAVQVISGDGTPLTPNTTATPTTTTTTPNNQQPNAFPFRFNFPQGNQQQQQPQQQQGGQGQQQQQQGITSDVFSQMLSGVLSSLNNNINNNTAPSTTTTTTSTSSTNNNSTTAQNQVFSVLNNLFPNMPPFLSQSVSNVVANSMNGESGDTIFSGEFIVNLLSLIINRNPEDALQAHRNLRSIAGQQLGGYSTDSPEFEQHLSTTVASVTQLFQQTTLPPELATRVVPNTNFNQIAVNVIDRYLRTLFAHILSEPSAANPISPQIQQWGFSFIRELVDSLAPCFQGGAEDACNVISSFVLMESLGGGSSGGGGNNFLGAFGDNSFLIQMSRPIVTNIVRNMYQSSRQQQQQQQQSTPSTSSTPTTPMQTTPSPFTNPSTTTTTTTTTTSRGPSAPTGAFPTNVIPPEWRETIEIDVARQESGAPPRPLSRLYQRASKSQKSSDNQTSAQQGNQNTLFQERLTQSVEGTNVNSQGLLNLEESKNLAKLYEGLVKSDLESSTKKE
eukprot:gene9205-11281_t